MNKDEIILLYGFKDGEILDKITKVLKDNHIGFKILKPADCKEKIGFLAGQKGFLKSSGEDEEFLDSELMVFQNIKGKRLDFALGKLRENNCEIPKFKAIITPFNIHWTLKKLYEKMKKEHGVLN